MSDPQTFLDAFPSWLKTLATDIESAGAALRDESLSEAQRRHVAGSINYLFKSLDLIPDGIEDVGYLDDAFVLRIAARLALAEGPSQSPTLARLAGEASLVASFLGDSHVRLENYVKSLGKGTARGRSVDEILADPGTLASLLGDVASWVAGYETPTFTRDEKTLVKLRSFLDAKLPR